VALELPDFPWDSLAPYADEARTHPDGIVDLSVGSPVDPTPELIRAALTAATDAHAYPQTAGSPALREAIVEWYARRRRVPDLGVANVIPTIGSKEFVSLLPTLLGLGPSDVVVQPTAAYPSYAVGAAVVGATVLSSDEPDEWPDSTRLVWLNSPGNPDGRVHGVEFLRRAVVRARELGAVIANDECYAELDWANPGETTPSILDPRVTQGSRHLTLSVYSLSKQSNLAGYRAGIVAGCSDLVGELLAARKNLGLIPPAPVQAAMIAALGDDSHVAAQRERYRTRREALRGALEAAGFRIDGSEAGLYLWATRGEDAWATVAALARLGILVTPGGFYGEAGRDHIRIALTVSDEGVRSAVERLAALPVAPLQ
jgi:succinyldiaminopimelate transaminase